MKASDVLRQAAEVIEQRGALRDKPDGERSMERAVAAYTALCGPTLESEEQGWIFMCVLKLARATAGKAHLDDYADLAGYAALAAECLSKETDDGTTCWPFNENKKSDPGSLWIEWGGGEPPWDDARVAVRFRNGQVEETTADQYDWTNWLYSEWKYHPRPDDIVAYKVIKNKETK